MMPTQIVKDFAQYVRSKLTYRGIKVLKKLDKTYVICDNGVYKLIGFSDLLKIAAK